MFEENCDIFDSSKWSFYWNPPVAQNGEWIFDFTAGIAGNRQANYRAMSGYGTYEIRFKIIGTRNAGVDFWIFLYGPYPDFDPRQMELDLCEVWGNTATKTHPVGEYSVSLWVNGKSSTMGIGYWYFNTIRKIGISFEDGNYHVLKYVCMPNDIIVYLDGIQMYKWSVDCTNKTALGMPVPPVQFMIGGGTRNRGAAAEHYQLIVDYMKHNEVKI